MARSLQGGHDVPVAGAQGSQTEVSSRPRQCGPHRHCPLSSVSQVSHYGPGPLSAEGLPRALCWGLGTAQPARGLWEREGGVWHGPAGRVQCSGSWPWIGLQRRMGRWGQKAGISTPILRQARLPALGDPRTPTWPGRSLRSSSTRARGD